MKRTLFFVLTLVPAMMWAMTPTEIESYYASIANKSGDNIVTTLQDRIDNHTVIGYNSLEPYYEQTDFENGRILDMYSICDFDMKDANCSQKKVCDCWNKEHSVPQSWFNEASPMKSDLFHVYPTDARVNNFRSNLPYGETSSTANVDNDSHALGHLGTSNFSGYTGKVYEPDDMYKGDFARTYMYMVTRYADKNFTQSAEGKVMFAYSNNRAGLTAYSINLLMKWHREDPVSQKEIDRNEAVYGIQKNRNPFIDYPMLAEYVWGEKKGQSFSFSAVISSSDPSFEPGVSDGSRVSTEPMIQVATEALTLGPVLANEVAQRTLSIRGANLTTAITLAVNNNHFSVSPTTIAAADANQQSTITLSYNPQAAGQETAVLTIKSGSVTKNVNLTGLCTEEHTVTWIVDGKPYTVGDPTTRVAEGSAPEVLPTAPTSCDEEHVFVGWSATKIAVATDVVPVDLFAFENEAPAIEANTTFYAVFAKQSGSASQSAKAEVHYSATTTVSTMSVGDIATITFDKADASNNPSYYVSGDAVRLYAKSTMTVTSSNTISKIEFESYSPSSTANELSTTVGSWDKESHIWTGEAQSIEFTVGGTSGHIKLNGIVVTTGGGVAYSDFLTELGCMETSVESVSVETEPAARKVMVDGVLYIERENRRYTVYGMTY